MNVGELFVNLGIKGSDKTVGAINTTKKGMGELASTSIEAKAAILGAMYALERMFAASGAAGTNLTNFNALTGLSTKQLQQWQYAARQAGVANEDFTGSLKSVQTSMTNMLLGKGAPGGLQVVAQMNKGFDVTRARDTFYVMEQLQKFAQKAPADVGNAMLKTFGLSEGVISAMRRGSFNKDAFKNAPTYSDKEIGSLDKANIAWSNLGQKIEMAVGHFNAKHGGELVKDFSNITTQVLKLVEALTTLSEKFKVLASVGHALEGIANVLKLFNEVADKSSGKQSKPGDLLYSKPGQELLPGFSGSPVGKLLSGLTGGDKESKPGEPFKSAFGVPMDPSKVAAPNLVKGPGAGSTQNVNVNQSLHFQHEGKDAKRTSDSVKKANQDAFRQFNQGQVN